MSGKFPPGARHNSDGGVSFPARGKPPECNVEGYEADPDDPFRWLMSWVECQHRRLQHPWCCPSGIVRPINYCVKKNVPINPRICKVDCTEPDKVINLSLDRLSDERKLSESPSPESQ